MEPVEEGRPLADKASSGQRRDQDALWQAMLGLADNVEQALKTAVDAAPATLRPELAVATSLGAEEKA